MLKTPPSHETQTLVGSSSTHRGVRSLFVVLAVSFALPACGDDDTRPIPDGSIGAQPDVPMVPDSGPMPDAAMSGFQGGTLTVVSPVWSENDCGAEQSIEDSYTFNSIGTGEFELTEVPGMVLEPDGEGGLDGELEVTRDFRPELQQCSLEIRVRMTVEPRGDGTFNSEHRIRIDDTPLGENDDCEEVATLQFGFAEWNSLAGCEWRVAYRLEP